MSPQWNCVHKDNNTLAPWAKRQQRPVSSPGSQDNPGRNKATSQMSVEAPHSGPP